MVLDELDSALYPHLDDDPLYVESINPVSKIALLLTGLQAEIRNADSYNGNAGSATTNRVYRHTAVVNKPSNQLEYIGSHQSKYLSGLHGTSLRFLTHTIYAIRVVTNLRGFHL